VKIVDFIVPGRPMGYVTRTWKGKHTDRAKAYHLYCDKVIKLAIQSGISTPLESTPMHLVRVDSKAFFEDHRHPDSENVRKGIVDALFYQSPQAKKILKLAGVAIYGDKYVDGRHYPGDLDKGNPRVEVRVAFYIPDKFKEVDQRMNQINLDNWAGQGWLA